MNLPDLSKYLSFRILGATFEFSSALADVWIFYTSTRSPEVCRSAINQGIILTCEVLSYILSLVIQKFKLSEDFGRCECSLGKCLNERVSIRSVAWPLLGWEPF